MDYKSASICSRHNCLLIPQLDLHITSVWCVCVCVCYVDDIYLLICNLILNLAVVLGTIFVHKPLISSEPIEAADPDLKAPVEMTPKSPTIHDPDQFHPAPSCTTYVHTAHNNATSDCLPLFLNKPFLTGFV